MARDLIFDGQPEGTPPSPTPVFPTPPEMPFKRGTLQLFIKLRDQIVANNNYPSAIGDDLGLIGPEITPKPPEDVAPNLKVSTTSGDTVKIGGSMQRMSGMRITYKPDGGTPREIAQIFNHLPEPPSPVKLLLAKKAVEPLRLKVAEAVREGKKNTAEDNQKKQNALLAEITALEAAQTIEHYDTGNVFDWSVEFAEIFEDGGFNIVLANPPYVRQEEIMPKEYKDELIAQFEAMTGKSDLFVAFYARGLQLLKDGGTHVFVCSNSWLDVGYGGKLQKYILDNAHMAAVYDSAVEWQFSTAAINTIISFIHKQEPQNKDETAFASLHAPFLEAIADETKRRVLIKS